LSKDKIKNLIYTFGKLLGLLGLIYVFYKLSKEFTLSSFVEKFSDFKTIIVPLIALNFLSSAIGIYVWHLILKSYSKKNFKYLFSYYYFVKTEISKYLPGNIFHFIGRQAIASKLNLSQKEMVKVSLLFMYIIAVGTVIAATIFALFSGVELYFKVLLTLASLLSIASLVTFFPKVSKDIKLIMSGIIVASISLQGILLSIIVVWQLGSYNLVIFFKVASIYIISWLIGFVTPGASGGLGVREGAFIAIAKFIHLDISSEIVLFSIFFVRFINIFTDIIMYLSTFAIKEEK